MGPRGISLRSHEREPFDVVDVIQDVVFRGQVTGLIRLDGVALHRDDDHARWQSQPSSIAQSPPQR